jgi:alanine-glyoxylate transaminase / serine-glyoxylate transaminase / serine-pyruvate transaminase
MAVEVSDVVDERAAAGSRLLLGAGPSPIPRRVMEALAEPTLGHLDPDFVAVMEEVANRLRWLFGTPNKATLALAATGSGGMEAVAANFVEPGDRLVCAVSGHFGDRLADALGRVGGDVIRVEADWGRAVAPERLIDALADGADAIACVHGETSTGVCQPLDGLADACREHDALLIVDCVTSLGGHPLSIDDAGVDVAYSATQKCIGAPPGLSPFTVSDRARARLARRRRPVASWYFDLAMLLDYWIDGSSGRLYHHTAPSNLFFALREALVLMAEERLARRWERHRRAHEALREALRALGLERLAADGEEVVSLLALPLDDRVDATAVQTALLRDAGIEISGGLGPFAGRMWRIGVMGDGARPEPQRLLVQALAREIRQDPCEALAALERRWSADD